MQEDAGARARGACAGVACSLSACSAWPRLCAWCGEECGALYESVAYKGRRHAVQGRNQTGGRGSIKAAVESGRTTIDDLVLNTKY